VELAKDKTHIVIHHSLTVDGNTVDWQAIRRYHTKVLGWADVGYHWGIEEINGEIEILAGRPMDYSGAHCLELNSVGIGICCVGNFDGHIPTTELLNKLRDFVRWLMRLYSIPSSNVVGHGEAQAAAGVPDAKTCPGRLFHMEEFRRSL
jgi:hypothetical protein